MGGVKRTLNKKRKSIIADPFISKEEEENKKYTFPNEINEESKVFNKFTYLNNKMNDK
jgi:hypothetical protein